MQELESVVAGALAAPLLTIVSTAVRYDLDAWVYVKDVLDQLLAGSTDYEALCADAWKRSHPEAIWHYRTDERRRQAECRQFGRAQLACPSGPAHREPPPRLAMAYNSWRTLG